MRMRLIATMLVGCAAVPSGLWGAGELSNRRAPSWNLPDARLQRYDLVDYRGKVVLIEFLQTNCPLCAGLSEKLKPIQQRFPGRVQVFGIVVTPPENQNTVNKFINDHGLNYPILFDSSQVAIPYLNITPANPKFEVPHLFVIDRNGRIAADYGHTDVASLNVATLGAFIETLLGPAPKKK
jgi:peroxiredoxin